MLGWLEVKQRYRRSVLGPFWLTLSTGVMIGGMGPLYGKLFGQPTSPYLAHLATSMVVWIFVSGLITEASMSFITSENYIKHMKLPLTVHVMRVVWKSLLILAHNLVIVVVVLFIYPPKTAWYLLLVPISVLVIALNGIWLGVLLGLLGARFRDIPPVVNSLVTVTMFLTPILWTPDMLGSNRWIADINPLFHFLEIVRRPLLGEAPPVLSWMAVIATTFIGYLIMLGVFQRFRARVPYWV